MPGTSVLLGALLRPYSASHAAEECVAFAMSCVCIQKESGYVAVSHPCEWCLPAPMQLRKHSCWLSTHGSLAQY
jgi:hypothetical protein